MPWKNRKRRGCPVRVGEVRFRRRGHDGISDFFPVARGRERVPSLEREGGRRGGDRDHACGSIARSADSPSTSAGSPTSRGEGEEEEGEGPKRRRRRMGAEGNTRRFAVLEGGGRDLT